MSAAKTPGIQANRVRINTIKIEPQPLSITASGGQTIDNNTLKKLIINFVYKYTPIHLYIYVYKITEMLHFLGNLIDKKLF